MNGLAAIQNTEVVQTAPINETLIDSFLRYADVAPKSVATYKRALRQFFKYLTERGIQQPQRTDILDYKTALAAEHKATTVQNYIAAVKVFFSWTAQVGIYPNIADKLKGVKVSKEHKKDYLTTNQIKSILSAIDTSTLTGLRDYAIIALITACGLRTIEVSRANVADLRTHGNDTVLYIQGKGRTEKADRITISAPVEIAIRAYLKARGSQNPNEPLFTSISNNSIGKGLSTRTISRICKERMQAVGLDSERLTAHSLRHTAITLLAIEGKDILTIQKFARHANINTTMIYVHSVNTDEAIKDCSASIAAAIF